MFLALVGERPRPARTPKNLLAGGTGSVHTDTKLAQGLEIPMAVSEARNADDRVAVGASNLRSLRRPLRTAHLSISNSHCGMFPFALSRSGSASGPHERGNLIDFCKPDR